MKSEKPKYGMITEQGDLGLGFDELSESDQQKIKETDSNTNKDKKREE
jgi:hypothetical protein